MIVIENINKPKNLYGDYFLAVEAPGDENEAPRPRNTKVINIRSNNRGKDYTSGIDDMDDTNQTNPEPTPDDNPPTANDTPDNPPTTVDVTTNDNTDNIVDDTDYTAGIDDDTTATEPATPDTPEQAPVANNPAPDVTATTDDANTPTPEPTPGGGDVSVTTADGTTTAPEGDAGGGEDIVDDTDYTAGIDSGDMGDAGAADTTVTDPNGQQDEQKGPAVGADSMRKYSLYKEFIKLLNAIDKYVETLDTQVVDDLSYNKAIRISTEKLKEIKMQCYDYLMLKFELDSYGKNLVFHQKIVVAIQLVFNMLAKIKTIALSKEKEEK